jgi:hypothetical protein
VHAHVDLVDVLRSIPARELGVHILFAEPDFPLFRQGMRAVANAGAAHDRLSDKEGN